MTKLCATLGLCILVWRVGGWLGILASYAKRKENNMNHLPRKDEAVTSSEVGQRPFGHVCHHRHVLPGIGHWQNARGCDGCWVAFF